LTGVSVTSRSLGVSRGEFVRGTRPYAIYGLIRRDWRIVRSYRTALLTDLTFGCLNLLVYYYISRTLKVSVKGGLDGAPSYFAFAAVGVSLSVVLQAAITGVSRRLREEQLTGTLEALYAQPISGTELAIGLAGFPFLFAVFRAFIYLLIAGSVLGLSFAHCAWVGLILSFLATGVALGAVGVALAALVLVFKRAEAVGALGTFGMSLLGGAFFTTRVLPHWIRPLADVVPTRFAFGAARDALFGRSDWISSAVVLAGFGVGLGALSLVLFSLALRHSVRRGTLNQY
jgi:ABC-2 type transport system permease protein